MVTGAGGFIGSAFCQYLATHTKTYVFGVGRSKLKASYPYIQIDLRDLKKIKELLARRRPDVIVHLAGGRADEPLKMQEDNLLTSEHLFKAVMAIKDYSPRIVMVGSAAEYGEVLSRRPINEDANVQPVSLYGWIKLLQTQTALFHAREGQDVVIARLFNIIGPGVPGQMAAGNFAKMIVANEDKGRQTFKVGHLGALRDFLDIRDVCEAIYFLMRKGKSGEVYNVCSGQGVTIKDLFSKMISASRNPSLRFQEDKKSNPGILYSVGSTKKLVRATKWKPKYGLAQSIEDMLGYARRSFL
jgi:nucleoside-diphosphate-sugar epimerase